MAIGDRIPTELTPPTALSATAATVFTNTTNYRAQLLEIWLSNTGATQRTITLFKNGLAAANQIGSAIVIPAGGSTIIQTHLVTTGTQTLGAKQDTGTDVNIAVFGVKEQIA
jgi:hypothetical protein